MRFLVDAQLPTALARWLVAAGHRAEHVGDCGLGSRPDHEIWHYAERVGAVIITKDEDFSIRRTRSDTGPAVIWIRLPNTRRRDLLLWFDRAFPSILEALSRGETLIEILRARPAS